MNDLPFLLSAVLALTDAEMDALLASTEPVEVDGLTLLQVVNGN